MDDVAIRVRDLGKRYRIRGAERGTRFWGNLAALFRGTARPVRSEPDEFWAVQEVNFTLHRGERLGIIGRNGAGKSTLLKILARIAYPTTGEARIRGRVTSLLEVGTGFNPVLSGRDNIYLNAAVHGLSRREVDARFDEIVEFSGVRDFLEMPVRHYSTGMFTRLAFSVAAHLDPDILLLDEVLAVGDLSFQQKCLGRMERLGSEGRTVLFVSHSMEAIARFCDRCIWLEQGRVVMDGPVMQVVDGYTESVLGVSASREWSPAPSSASELAGDCSPADSAVAPAMIRDDGHDGAVVAGGAASAPHVAAASADQRPGDEWARLVSARVIDAQGATVSSVAIDDPVGIEVVFDVLKAGRNVQPALHFLTPQGSVAFVAAYTDPTHLGEAPDTGRHRARAWIPSNLLNAGILYVELGLNTPDPLVRHCRVERALSFSVYERQDAMAGTARGLYAREFPGVVRPLLRWETERLDPAYDGDQATNGVAAPRP
ncbi:MAG: ABC transporter ATP-binding protein [Candidatus Rokuibacteriota bacterium]